ncbi:MAG TPA: hypothetical protein VFH31_19475 [Pyrinomonadaceae bacterium]|nr:hypothetical protein [Pyrinomonadaceae bacterium]
MEAFIGAYWVLFNTTHLAPPNGFVLIGLGRDAFDVSVCTALAIARTSQQDVRCEMPEGYFHSLAAHELSETAISLDARKE